MTERQAAEIDRGGGVFSEYVSARRHENFLEELKNQLDNKSIEREKMFQEIMNITVDNKGNNTINVDYISNFKQMFNITYNVPLSNSRSEKARNFSKLALARW